MRGETTERQVDHVFDETQAPKALFLDEKIVGDRRHDRVHPFLPQRHDPVVVRAEADDIHLRRVHVELFEDGEQLLVGRRTGLAHSDHAAAQVAHRRDLRRRQEQVMSLGRQNHDLLDRQTAPGAAHDSAEIGDVGNLLLNQSRDGGLIRENHRLEREAVFAKQPLLHGHVKRKPGDRIGRSSQQQFRKLLAASGPGADYDERGQERRDPEFQCRMHSSS